MNDITAKCAELLTELRKQGPLIHHITNYVTVNDCANVTLAIGASPVMADDIGECSDITAISSALLLNIGTLNGRTIASMLASGKRANQLGIPVVFDPVGAGASLLRNKTTRSLLEQVRIGILRGNLSEITYAAGFTANTKGVDASEEDSEHDAAGIATAAAAKWDCVAAITGAVDVIAGKRQIVHIANGHPMLTRVTGTGCMTTSLVASCAGASGDPFVAAVTGVACMGIAGEIAFEAAGMQGIGSFHAALIDALSRMDADVFVKRARLNEN